MKKPDDYIHGTSSLQGREKLEDVIQKMVGKNNRVVNEAMPIADAPIGGWFQESISY